MNGRRPTAEESKWMDTVQQQGCIVCKLHLDIFSPAEIHHIEGSRKYGSHYQTIALCPLHHRYGVNTEIAVSRHPYKKEFEKRYGTEQELLEKTREIVNALHE